MKLPAMAKRRVRYFRDRKFATAWSKREDPYVVLKKQKKQAALQPAFLSFGAFDHVLRASRIITLLYGETTYFLLES
jgi:hypothetical protein